MSHNNNHHQRASTPDVIVTPSSSTSVRKRSFLDSSEPQLNDPSFRTSCKKRFLRLRQNSHEAFFTQTPQRSIDVLRDVVRDELLQSMNQDQQQYEQAHTELDDTHHDPEANDDCGDAAMASYNSHEPTQLQSRQIHALPRANHYVDDEELYDLLLEMEHELKDSIATKGNHSEAHNIESESPVAQETSIAVMTDWEEEMYYMSTRLHEDDAVQEQIMDYYNGD
jgi:hypothetical protein